MSIWRSSDVHDEKSASSESVRRLENFRRKGMTDDLASFLAILFDVYFDRMIQKHAVIVF